VRDNELGPLDGGADRRRGTDWGTTGRSRSATNLALAGRLPGA